jgi:hypothetical protein
MQAFKELDNSVDRFLCMGKGSLNWKGKLGRGHGWKNSEPWEFLKMKRKKENMKIKAAK